MWAGSHGKSITLFQFQKTVILAEPYLLSTSSHPGKALADDRPIKSKETSRIWDEAEDFGELS